MDSSGISSGDFSSSSSISSFSEVASFFVVVSVVVVDVVVVVVVVVSSVVVERTSLQQSMNGVFHGDPKVFGSHVVLDCPVNRPIVHASQQDCTAIRKIKYLI